MKIIKTAGYKEYDIILRHYGGEFMPIIKDDSGEVLRGSYYESAYKALEVAMEWMNTRGFTDQEGDGFDPR